MPSREVLFSGGNSGQSGFEGNRTGLQSNCEILHFFREGEGNLSKKIGRCQKCAKFQLDVVAAIEGNYCAFLDRTGSRSHQSVLREEDSPCKSW